MEHDYLLRRVPAPELTPLAAASDLGGQQDWFWGMPGVHQALASPCSYASIPEPPRGTAAPHHASLGYWAPLHNLLLYRLGWSRPDRGLRWWYDAGKPVDDPTLAFIAAVWDRDGRLDGYLAWLLRLESVFLDPTRSAYGQHPGHDFTLPETWQRWLAETIRTRDETRYPHFGFDMSGDPLHLCSSGGQHNQVDAKATLVIIAPSKRTAAFHADRADSWYFTLMANASTLPDIGNNSWYVDVYVKPIGFLGTFRRSRVTGNWFSGRHHIHSQGN
ncbi:hypothetical protein NYA9BBAC_00084 [Salinibacterium sp. NYA9b]